MSIAIKSQTKPRNCAYTGETKSRSWAKSLLWRVIGILILGGISWAITRSWEETSLITIIFHGIRLILYYYHERAWDNVDWGRIRAKENLDRGEGI
ncbi:MAG: DUF2061 domain-containing protein [Chloroflexi bacterium]|nr:DUF2061 domain-containing protein [Chloroflexota bacterium]